VTSYNINTGKLAFVPNIRGLVREMLMSLGASEDHRCSTSVK